MLMIISALVFSLLTGSVIGAPLFTVPIFVFEGVNISSLSLCYEVNGEADTYFNLVTDECASVNAHYYSATQNINLVDEIGVRAVDNGGNCKNISVSLANNCSVSVDGIPMTGHHYSADGIFISVLSKINRVRISVPNCNKVALMMKVECMTRAIQDPHSNSSYTGDMIDFTVERGLNFGHGQAHGLLGQLWRVPVRVLEYTGPTMDGDDDGRYVVSHTSAFSGEPRAYTGLLYRFTWTFQAGPCLYVGNRQGGPINEVYNPNDSVIEGHYMNYTVPSAFSEEGYVFGLFNETRCTN